LSTKQNGIYTVMSLYPKDVFMPKQVG